MKARVVKEYIDKYTQELHAVGDEVSLTDERFAEITKAGRYVEEMKQDEEPAEKVEEFDDDLVQGPSDQDPVESVEDSADQEPAEPVEDLADQEPAEPAEPIKTPKKPHRK